MERRRLEQILFDSEKLAATGRLAASIAHEINNPLEAIKNALYLLTYKLASSRIENELDPFLPPIIASSDQIKQVLLKLMLNGQQAMPQGGTIFVSTRVSQSADPEFLMSKSVHIQVRCTGNGIPEEHLPHIFEPFFSTKDEKGTGLWVSQGIVQAHGGSIKLRSHQARGTTFSVALPIAGPDEHGPR